MLNTRTELAASLRLRMVGALEGGSCAEASIGGKPRVNALQQKKEVQGTLGQ